MNNEKDLVKTDYERLRWRNPDTGTIHVHIIKVLQESKECIYFQRHNKWGDPLLDLHIISPEFVIKRTPLKMSLKYSSLS